MSGCTWYGDDPFYKAYLDGFQAGLSWITILRKRDNFHAAFNNFNPELIASYDDKKVEALMQDSGIVRNRAKILGTIKGAQLFLEIEEKENGFSRLLWDYLEGQPVQNDRASMADVPAETELSRTISKDLKKRGFKFVGPTIVYAFMQAVGMVNDHVVSCPRHQEVKLLAR